MCAMYKLVHCVVHSACVCDFFGFSIGLIFVAFLLDVIRLLTVPFQSAKMKKKQQKAELQHQKENQRETMLKGISQTLRITSALNLIDDSAKDDLREGKNGAPVGGASLPSTHTYPILLALCCVVICLWQSII